MKIQKLAALLAAFVLLTTAGAQEGKKEAKKELSNTRIASCLVKITCDPAVLPLSFETIDQLLNSSGVAGKAAREILEIPMLTDETEELVHFEIGPISDEPESERVKIEYEESEESFGALFRSLGATPRTMAGVPTYASEQILFFRLVVELEHNVKPAAEEFMKALLDNLHKTFNAAFKDYSKRFRQQLEFADNDVQRAEADLAGLQKKLREILGSHNPARDAILDDISNLRIELRTTEMEHETNEVVIEAISKRIKETEGRMHNKLADDSVIAELQKIINIHEERIKRLGNKGAPEPETSEARENLARARIELAERREQISESAGGELLRSLNNQLAEVTMQRTRADRRGDHLRNQLSYAEHLLGRADDYERLSLRAKVAKQAFEDALFLHSRMKRKGLLIQPSVVVFGAD